MGLQVKLHDLQGEVMNASGKSHYRYRRSTEELAALEEVNRAGAYQPTWESLDGHAAPEWFEDAKFGMFLDWGLYSVPGWGRPNPDGGPTYPDWYVWDMYERAETRDYHARTWGAEFRRDDFIPLFDASEYDAAGRKDVAVNDRYGDCPESRGRHGDFFTSEFNVERLQSREHKWEECRSIGRHFGYNREVVDSDVLSPSGLVHMLVDIVSRNGNLLLVVNPTGSGALLPMELARLQAVGQWLRVNGEAIYATRQYRPASLEAAGAGDRADKSVRFTASKDGRFVYAIATAWPGDTLALPAVQCRDGAAITMLGVEQPLRWARTGDSGAGGLTVEIPPGLAQNRPCEHAWVLRIPQH